MDAKNITSYRVGKEGKILFLSTFLIVFCLGLPNVAALTVYHPALHRNIPVTQVDPIFLWENLDKPEFRRENDAEGIRRYLQSLEMTERRAAPLTWAELEELGIEEVYNPITRRYQLVQNFRDTQLQYILQNRDIREITLRKANMRPLTLKALYQAKNTPKIKIPKPALFRNSQLCITWVEHGRVVKQTPPGCD